MIKIPKGSTFKIVTTVFSSTNIRANIIGSTITAIFKKNPADLDGQSLFTKNIGSGVSITDGANGVCETLIPSSDTNSLSYDRVFYEVVVKLASGEHIRSGQDEIVLLPTVLKTLN